jgi:lipoprotein NlpI
MGRKAPGAHVLFIVGNLQSSLKLNKLARQEINQKVMTNPERNFSLRIIQ